MHRYRMNTPSIISETLDGEVVILNLDKGIYYSIGGVGTHIWGMLTRGMNLSEIAGFFKESEIVKEGVQRFIDELLEKELIVETTDSTPSQYAVDEPVEYAQPILHIYEDMKELLLLDPIHEVDQSGWPVAP